MSGTHVIRSIVWKEYRLQRPFWIAIAVLVVVSLCIINLLTAPPDGRIVLSIISALTGTALYALGCTATLFATEHENGTYEFQRSLPVSAPRLIFGKVLFAVLSITIMLIFLLALAHLSYCTANWWHGESFGMPLRFFDKIFFTLWGSIFVEAFVWGCFFSLLLRRPLLAAILAVTCASLCINIIIISGDKFFREHISRMIEAQLLILAVLILWAIWLGARWFKEENWWTQWRTRRDRRPIYLFLPHEVAQRPSLYSRNPFPWLLWQQRRQNGWIALAVTCLLLLLLITSVQAFAFESYPLYPLMRFNLSLWTYLVGLIAILLWSMLFFHADYAQQNFRFLTERGVSPNLVWLSRQALGIIPLIVAGLIFIVFFLVVQLVSEYKQFYRAQPVENFFLFTSSSGFLVLVLFLVYSVVQFCSLFFRSGILAAFFSLLFTVLLMSWTSLMIFWAVPWWWSIAPLPFLFLLATWLRTPGWLLERNDLRTWLRPALALVPIVAIIAAVPFYRVYSVPWVEPGFSEKEISRATTPEAQGTLKLYERAWNEYVGFAKGPDTEDTLKKKVEETKPEKQPWTPPPPLTEAERTWVASNSKTIQLTIEASQRSECYIPQNENWGTTYEEKLDWISARYAVSKLCQLLICSAQQLQEDGQPAKAWEHYSAALRVTDHCRGFWYYYHERRAELYQQLPAWASSKETTPEQIQLAIQELKRHPPDISKLRNDLFERYSQMRDLLQGKENYQPDYFAGAEKLHFDISFWLWRQFLPWELIRAERLLNIQVSTPLFTIKRLENCLKNNESTLWATEPYDYGPLETALALHKEVVLPGNYCFSFDESESFITQVVLYRATLIELALVSWEKSHGEYPADLEQITEIFGGPLPMDPFSGRPFRYMPQGLTSPWEISNYYFWRGYVLEAGHPFLWSTGRSVEYVHVSSPEEDNHYAPRIIEWRSIPGFSTPQKIFTYPILEQELFSHGLTFPLP